MIQAVGLGNQPGFIRGAANEDRALTVRVKFEQGGDHRDEHRAMNRQSILRQLWFERRVLC